jgi:hypothetical protein
MENWRLFWQNGVEKWQQQLESISELGKRPAYVMLGHDLSVQLEFEKAKTSTNGKE